VDEAHAAGVDVEGELEAIRRVEEGPGAASEPYPVETAVAFIEDTGVGCFAPAIGNAHGLYQSTPSPDSERGPAIVQPATVPIALHGGTGMSQAQFDDLISRGCAKVNISTALKIAYIDAHQDYLGAFPGVYVPPDLFRHVHRAVRAMAREHIGRLGGEGRAWEPCCSTATACWRTPSETGTCRRSTRCSPRSGCPCAGPRGKTAASPPSGAAKSELP